MTYSAQSLFVSITQPNARLGFMRLLEPQARAYRSYRSRRRKRRICRRPYVATIRSVRASAACGEQRHDEAASAC